MSTPKAPRAMLSRQWSCSSVHEGVCHILKDCADNMGQDDGLDDCLMEQLEASSLCIESV